VKEWVCSEVFQRSKVVVDLAFRGQCKTETEEGTNNTNGGKGKNEERKERKKERRKG
jgi:hypothetical protein